MVTFGGLTHYDDDQITATSGLSPSQGRTKARERRMLITKNAAIITVQQKKRPQVLTRLPLVHRFS